jgi:tRNA G18 (ribose-2'-O)-methylase SpoU
VFRSTRKSIGAGDYCSNNTCRPLLRDQGFTVAALELTPDAVDVNALAQRNPDRLALVLGTEGAGMSAATLAAVDHAVRIPMRAGVDSLQ